ncbi:hypothetical protein DFH06DRAFT_365225 [Mycena polygramma]|nr:hypothetical protein DFH06DRAFT_365225 [Mycena polygramma]
MQPFERIYLTAFAFALHIPITPFALAFAFVQSVRRAGGFEACPEIPSATGSFFCRLLESTQENITRARAAST